MFRRLATNTAAPVDLGEIITAPLHLTADNPAAAERAIKRAQEVVKGTEVTVTVQKKKSLFSKKVELDFAFTGPRWDANRLNLLFWTSLGGRD